MINELTLAWARLQNSSREEPNRLSRVLTTPRKRDVRRESALSDGATSVTMCDQRESYVAL